MALMVRSRREILLQRHVGRGVKYEAPVAGRRLALGSRQGVFLVGVGMQKDREVGAHRPEAPRGHLLRAGAHHDVIAVLHGEAEQFVAHRPAHHVNAHQRLLHRR
jgi:hypothetical protein